jgi:hypothetical protein
MAGTRCIHGIDDRFCAICLRNSRSAVQAAAAAAADVDEVVRFLNDERTRATYGAVASVLGVPVRSVGGMLGGRRQEASWIVNDATGLPTDYEQTEWHPELMATAQVIRTGTELTLRLSAWRAKAK